MAEPLADLNAKLDRVLAKLDKLPDFTLWGHNIDRLLAEMRMLRNDFSLLREQVHLQGGEIARLADTVRMDVLDRLQKLEATRPE